MNCLSDENERLINHDIFLSTAPSPLAIRNRESRSGTGNIGTIFLIVNATLGAGLLNFPQAFDKAGGIATSIITQLMFLVFITAALVILAKCSDITNTCTMQNTFAGLCGPKSLLVCSLCVAIYSFGCCLTFLIIVGDQFDRVFATFYGFDFCHNWYMSRPFVTVVTTVTCILPLCFFKRLDVLSYASSIGCVTILYVAGLITYRNFANINKTVRHVKIWPDNNYEALQMVPIICFAYQSHMTAIPTYACMKHRRIKKFTMCAVISMAVCFAVYTIVGICGYMTFGSGRVPSDILQGYTDKSTFLTVAIISMAVKNFTTYPIVLYCGRDAVLGLFNMDLDINTTARYVITLIWFILSLIIAILVPDIFPVISLLGSLSAAFIFILPGICLLQSILLKDPELFLNKDRVMIVLAIFITALGAFVCGVVFVEALQDLTKQSTKPLLVNGLRMQLRESLCT